MMTKEINERELALAVLLEIEKGNKSHLMLRQVLEKYQYLDKKGRAFLTRLAEGTTERRLELDYIIDQFSKVKTAKMKPVIRNIMRCAVYQMKYMDHVPASAACNEAVKLAVKKGFGSLRGFVNGVLRNIARNLDQVSYPGDETPALQLSVKWSMPLWIVEMWTEAFGLQETERILAEFYRERSTTVRVNEQQITKEKLMEKLTREGVTVEEHPEIASALCISGYDYLGGLASFCEGDYQVQDASSILAAESAGIQSGDYVLDVCAAPGGKALHAAQILAGSGHVEARDLTESKVELIRENIARMGFDNIEAVQQDALIYDEGAREKADVLLADLPCSGLGVLAKKTDLKYNVTREAIHELAGLQRQILSAVHSYVKPGGTLLYSTCTICREENEENTAWFVREFPEFSLEWERQILPSVTSDGFYLAKMKRRDA